ncbi:MAG: ATP-binding protein [Granulosicoccaceae bacterium]|jgi:lon-related putative ATP-dependent protease
MSQSNELKPEALFTSMDPAILSFKTTDEVASLEEVIGQARAIGAIELGIGINKAGFNLFALGPSGIGKQSTITQYLSGLAKSQETPSDWCYVNNFEDPHKPTALRLPAGKGQELRSDLQKLIDDTRTSMPVAFESDEYRTKLQEIQDKYEERRRTAISELSDEAAAHDVALIRGAHGFILGPIIKGKVIDANEFSKLPEKEQQRLSEIIEIFEEKLSALLQRMPQLAREERAEIRALDRETAIVTVDVLIRALIKKYKELPEVCQYFKHVRNDIAEHVEDFTDHPEQTELFGIVKSEGPSFRRYEVNLLIDNKNTRGAPIIYEDNPVYQKLTGRVEHESRMGTLVTDFTHIKPGALHCANGGYLLLDAIKLLRQPFAWDALKRALFANKISIQSIGSLYGILDTASLEPQPIPLDIKVVLLGERILYYLLLEYDHDFRELFKVAADFEEDMDRTEDNIQLYAKLIATLAKKEKLLAFDAQAVSRVIEHSSRLANDAEKLSAHMLSIVDLMQESEHWAKKSGSKVVGSDAVQQAIDAQIHRASRLKEKMQGEIQRETILIDTEGDKVASVNGLAVIDLSNYRFAHPVRITATTRLGDGEVIDIEREVELGGAIHSKGVLILSSFLASRYTKKLPLSLSASLTFEQSYGMVEGDSASMAELCALLSSLADAPIHQSIAITGSVNQLGQVQPIGGVNEKIEGFFDVCKARGLNGEHGVIIPQSNVKHLMLRHEVVEAVTNKQFHVYPVENIDQAIEILTGVPAGEADAEGKFPADSINYRAEQKLLTMSQYREKFIKPQK